jgi:hypothetical protein
MLEVTYQMIKMIGKKGKVYLKIVADREFDVIVVSFGGSMGQFLSGLDKRNLCVGTRAYIFYEQRIQIMKSVHLTAAYLCKLARIARILCCAYVRIFSGVGLTPSKRKYQDELTDA